ncbi:MAG: hypothetical protein KDC35_14065 [Acidobacteria bacterium]|nr:hypothetical protein [Acidobacteriota bacterium]
MFILVIVGLMVSEKTPYVAEIGRYLEPHEMVDVSHVIKTPGHYSAHDWASAIDATWVTGLSTADKLAFFDYVWQDIHDHYGAFHNTNITIDEIRARYRDEIAAGVSRGRFAGIMTHFMQQLEELHTNIADLSVVWGTPLQPGVPVMVVGAWGDTSHFGASLTPLADGTALVYRVAQPHVLDLKPGDIVLGYDGIPWPDLIDELLAAELPIRRNGGAGSTPKAMKECLVMAAGENWHLFDTIDIRRHDTGEVVSLPTSLLVNQTGYTYGNEQLPVAGVAMPDWRTNDHLTWGRMDGTHIGYIYVGSWSTSTAVDIENKFYSAIQELHDTDALIIDFRRNLGGYMLMAHRGYALLFNKIMRLCAFDVRGNDPDDFWSVKPHPQFSERRFTFSSSTEAYQKPIAVLTGPGAQSNGDWESIRIRAHERVRSFGRATNGGFTSSDNPVLPVSNWWYQKATGSGYLTVDHDYLTHRGSPVDEEIWLTPDDVAVGTDTVVARAVAWIHEKMAAPADRVYVIPELEQHEQGHTLISMVNPSPKAAQLHVEGISNIGISYGPTPLARALPPYSSLRATSDEWFPDLRERLAWIKVTSSEKLAIHVDMVGPGTQSAYRPTDHVSANWVVPHVAADTSLFETHVAAVNVGPVGQSVQLVGPDQATNWSGFGNGWTQNSESTESFWPAQPPPWITGQGDLDQLSMMEWFAYQDGSAKAALPVWSSGATQLRFLHVAQDTDLFWTGMVYLNPNEQATQVTERYVDPSGTVVEVVDRSVAAGEKIVLLSDNQTSLPDGTAWMDVTSDLPLVGYELFGSANHLPDRFIVGLNAATQSQASWIFDRVPRNEDEWVGLVAVNTSDVTGNITLNLYSDSGEQLAKVALNNIPANGKVTHTVRSLFPNTWSEGAWIMAHSDDMNWAGFLLWGDQARTVLSGTSAFPLTE